MTKRYRDSSGKILIWPTFLRVLGDICLILGLLMIIGGILGLLMEGSSSVLIAGIIAGAVFGLLMTRLYNAAEKSAARKNSGL